MATRRDAPLPGAPDPWATSAMPSVRRRAPYLMTEMIAAEPALAERLARRLARDERAARLAELVRGSAASRRPVVVTGCGTSEHAAMGVAEILSDALQQQPGRELRAIDALEALHRPLADGLLLGVSHEGGTWATIEAMRAAAAAGARTALITVSDRSPAAEGAELVVITDEQDQSWCHTVGYLSPLVVATVVAAIIAGRRHDAVALRALLDVADDPHRAASVAARLGPCARLLVAGSGIDHVSARELALKIEEGSHGPATAHRLETVRHGHLAAADERTGLILVLSDVAAATAGIVDRAGAVLRSAASLGMPAAAIVGPDADSRLPASLTPAGRIVLPTIRRVAPVPGTLVASGLALQLLAERLARARGVNPDTIGREDPRQAAAHD